ncbi:hypothetical protein SpiBuddy_2855 [Sphaerochaeta globosa str. Buddy]|uniref:Uncharacterized protein n=1 Tax=Sphaerochaeta globosa (strain ATCC BAA-1886 / DSM 22777 / Buddy) TaxID=158189 RepID=F0RS58_SPHGB|nr:hypothetical protein SpiBuddy_2855 [Sphaerochaeta globosa str. Buddy]
MRLSAYSEAWEDSCKNHTIVSMLGTDFTYEVLPVGAAQIPAFVRGGGSKKEKGVCLQDAYY